MELHRRGGESFLIAEMEESFFSCGSYSFEALTNVNGTKTVLRQYLLIDLC